MVKVSVIMPVYNTKEAYLRQAIESVLNQTFTDFELIIVNDGSTIGTIKILDEYVRSDERIRGIHQINQGLSCARNNGLSIAQGEFIAFIDSDDFYAPNFLEYLIDVSKQTKADIVGCDFKKINSKKDSLKKIRKVSHKVYGNALNTLLHKNNFIHFNVWNKLYKKELFKDVIFVPNIYYEDWIFNCCAFAKISTFAWIKDALYGYRISPNSIMRSDFNLRKLNDYVKGIEIVAEFYQSNYPNLWEKVKKTRIARTVKMLMNSTIKANDKTLYNQAKDHLKRLYQRNIICYSGLSFANKIKLYKFLYMERL